MRPALLGGLGFVVAMGATFGVRSLSRPPPQVEAAPAPAKVHRRTRIRMVRTDCPGGLEGFDAQLADLQAETDRVLAETRGLDRRSQSLGQAWPDELNVDVRPDDVFADVNELLPEDAIVTWACDSVPCTAMVVLPDEDPDRALALQEALEERYPGSTPEPWQVDREAYATDDPDAARGHALVIQAMPELTEDPHKAWAYYAARHPRRLAREAMRAELMED